MYSKHEYIHRERPFGTRRPLYVLRLNLDEDRRVDFSSEVRGRYWKSDRISLFTRVVTTMSWTRSFATVGDDISHDTAPALLALQNMTEAIEEPCFPTLYTRSTVLQRALRTGVGSTKRGKNKPVAAIYIFSASQTAQDLPPYSQREGRLEETATHSVH